MAYFINLKTSSDKRGALTVVEKVLPFEIQRVFYVYYINGRRGGHSHKTNIQALIALNGEYEIFVDNGRGEEVFHLKTPDQCLILKPEDWHTMEGFSKESILLVLASEHYDPSDYVYERP